jgi:diguanylate cyclase (GGDEF)-like protein/PAS domain S-box-containing protein
MLPKMTELSEIIQDEKKRNQLFPQIFERAPDGVMAVDLRGIIWFFNARSEQITGLSGQDVIGRMHISKVYADLSTAKEIKKLMMDPAYGEKGTLSRYETEIRHSDGRIVPIQLSASLLYVNELCIGNYGFFHDITLRKSLEKKLKKLSITDELTGLNNRRHFNIIAEIEVKRAKRYDSSLCLMISDLDHFKEYNDTHGHQAGDNILKLYGTTLQKTIRSTDYAFRFGGDEFVVLLPNTTQATARIIADRISSTFSKKFSAEYDTKKTAPVTISTGITQMQHTDDLDALLRRADDGLYKAKKYPGNYHTVQ